MGGLEEHGWNGLTGHHHPCTNDTTLHNTTTGAVRLALELLQGLDRAIGLFALPPFRAAMQLPYALTVLELLLARAHPLLRDELVALLQAMTVRVDAGWLFESLFPQVLIKVSTGSGEQEGVGGTLASVVVHARAFWIIFHHHKNKNKTTKNTGGRPDERAAGRAAGLPATGSERRGDI